MENPNVPTTEELAAEQAALKVPTPEEVKTKVIEEYGFDETTDAERIQKIVDREIDQAKKISSAIGAKIKHRTSADELRKKVPADPNPTPDTKKEGELTAMDAIALTGAGVTVKEDIDAVVEYAGFKKISIEKALESSIVKTTLAENAQFRRTADTTNIGGGRRAPAQVSDETLLSNSKEGKVPDDDAGINRLVAAKAKENRG